MADQEFLASFGVDIDESGVSRLQKILTENKTLGDSLAASFNAAAEGVKAFKGSISTDLICSYEQLNDLLLPFRHLRDGKGMGSLFCLHPGGRNVGDSHSVPAEHGTEETVPLFRADPAKGNLTEFQVLWGDRWI